MARLYLGIFGMGPFSSNWENILLFMNENSRSKYPKLGILDDFRVVPVVLPVLDIILNK